MNHRADESGDYSDQRATPFERHLQTGIGAVLILLVGWIGFSVSDTTTRLAVLESKVAALNVIVSELRADLKTNVDDRYRGSDARRDFAQVYENINRLRARVDKLEEK